MKLKNININVRFVLGFLLLISSIGFSQKPSFNANTVVNPYTGDFAYGCNPGYYGGYNNNATNDKLMGDLFFKAGFHTTRPALYDRFLEEWGTNIRIPEFDYYAGLGMKEMTLFVSGPSEAHQDTTTIMCNGVKKRSKMFKNLYTPIWITGSDGKQKVNPNNYYAAYVYKLVTVYGKYVKFYEVWNEPDFTTGANPYKQTGAAGNWYDKGANPCELDNMYAEIETYIRTLRITYEVVKSVDQSAYVTTGGIGYESFLEYMMKSTDNPDGGKVTAEYPLKAGAYFDVLSYHYYPQYNLGKWDNKKGGFAYQRHSDKAMQIVFEFQNKLQTVLSRNGYDGKIYPAKHYILTEVNIPRMTYAGKDWMGSIESQRNFIIKTFVGSQKNNVKQMYVYCLGDKVAAENSKGSTDGMDLMGMFLDLNKATPANVKLSAGGEGAKTVSDFLYTYKYDAGKTAAMSLPANVDGGAFTKGSETRYVLWAKTITDLSEISAATYSFPSGFGVKSITTRPTTNSVAPSSSTVIGNTIILTGAPSFITVNGSAAPTPLALSVNAGKDKIITLPTVTATLQSAVSNGIATSYSWTKKSGPAIILQNSTTPNLTLSNLVAGTYVFNVTVKSALLLTASDDIQVTVVSESSAKATEESPATFKVVFPTFKKMNNWKDKSTTTFYRSTIRVQVESTNPDAVKSVVFDLDGKTNIDDWADVSGSSLPATYSFHNTYYALEPGAHVVNMVVTDKKGIKTSSKTVFYVSNENAPQLRDEGEELPSPLESSVLSETGPYFIYTIQGVLLAQGTGRFDTENNNLSSGIYICKTADKSLRFLIEK